MSQEFESGVIEILNKYQPEILFVETSGAAEPFPVFLSLQNLGVSVEGVISVVDAKNYDSYMHNPTAKYQVGGSNILVLNKTDLVTEEELKKAEADIIAYKEKHDIKNTMTGKKVFNNYFIHHAQQGVVPKDVFEGVYQIEEIIGLVTDGHDHDHNHDAIDRRVGKLDAKIRFEELDLLLQSLPKNIYRVKGMVKVEDVPTYLIVNYSFGNVSFDELHGYEGDSALVFIGEEIDLALNALAEKLPFLSIQEEQHNHEHDHDHHHHHDHDHTHDHHH
jgi:G3E family GTPase